MSHPSPSSEESYILLISFPTGIIIISQRGGTAATNNKENIHETLCIALLALIMIVSSFALAEEAMSYADYIAQPMDITPLLGSDALIE